MFPTYNQRKHTIGGVNNFNKSITSEALELKLLKLCADDDYDEFKRLLENEPNFCSNDFTSSWNDDYENETDLLRTMVKEMKV